MHSDATKLKETNYPEQFNEDLNQPNGDLPSAYYMDDLVDIFIDQWERSRPKRRHHT